MPTSLPILEREDLALFINAASAATGQTEFYGADRRQRISVAFLHDYVFGNYRRLYALSLVAGINDYNRALVVQRLLAAGAPPPPDAERESALIRRTLADLPPQRVYRLFRSLRAARVNNRRTRATLRTWLATRDLTFDAVKYRGLLRSAVRHARLRVDDDLHAFLFDGPESRRWTVPLWDAVRRARYEQRAVFELPFTVAEGFAAHHGIPRRRFLERIAPRMTAAERRRHLDGTDPTTQIGILATAPLTTACRALLARPIAERDTTWRTALEEAARRLPDPGLPRRVRAVLDNSYSSRGGARKRNHPLATALSVHLALSSHCEDYRGFWTHPTPDPFTVRPRGPTRLADPLLDALDDAPGLLIVVSDGYENDPVGAAGEVVRLFRTHVDPHGQTAIVHLNPVFDATAFMPRALGPSVPTVGIRDASELQVKLAFARFTHGDLPLSALEAWLEDRWNAR
jgi:hypothetical protein